MRFYRTWIIYLWFCTSLVQAFYEPQGSISYKQNRQRHIGRMQLLYPLKQHAAQLFYTSIIGLLDNQHASEGNVGLGYRVLHKEAIVGGYGFYDLRKTFYQNRMQQMTLGVEYLTLHDELRTNLYIPFSAAKPIESNAIHTFSTKSVVSAQLETPLAGFDIEWRHNFSFLPNLQCSATYYYFDTKHTKRMQGLRFKLDYQVTPWLSVEGETSTDKNRSLNYFLGIRLTLSSGSKQAWPPALEFKMIQMPIRDIDVIVKPYSWDGHHSEPAFVITTAEELQQIGSGMDGMTLDANYVLDVDIDLSEITTEHSSRAKGFKPIGTKKHPFTGRFFGQGHIITGLFIEHNQAQQHLGLFGSTCGTPEKPVLIEKIHLTFVSIKGGRWCHIGGLIGRARQSVLRHTSSQGHIAGYHSSKVGGLVGWICDHSYLSEVYSISDIWVGDGGVAGNLLGGMDHSHLERASSVGSIQGRARGCIGGLIGRATELSYCFDVHSTSTIQAGAASMLGGLIGETDQVYLARAYSRGSISGQCVCMGGLVGWARNDSQFLDIYSLNDIQCWGTTQAVGGLMGWTENVQLKRAYFAGTLHIPNNVITGAIVGEQYDSSNFYATYWDKAKLLSPHASYRPFGRQVAQAKITSTPCGISEQSFADWFDDGVWTMSGKRPVLISWTKRQDALTVLQYLNHLKRFKYCTFPLPLELEVLILSYMQPHHSLGTAEIMRLLNYASTPITQAPYGPEKLRTLWSKGEFLAYVLRA